MAKPRHYLLLLILACSSCYDPPKTPAEYSKLLVDADKVTLYSLDGWDVECLKESNKKAEKLCDYPILGKIEITDAQTRKELVEAVSKGLEGNAAAAACFVPRHALRTVRSGRTVDCLICFECTQVQIHYGSDFKTIPIDKSPQELLNRLLKKAKIPILPERTP
jgi:hypothetical protein